MVATEKQVTGNAYTVSSGRIAFIVEAGSTAAVVMGIVGTIGG